MGDETDDSDSVFTEAQMRHEEWVEKMMDEHGCLPPGTYAKALGHEILLNEDAEVAPSHRDNGDGVIVAHRSNLGFGAFLPRETGTFYRFQTDGMVMKHPVLEGTFCPIKTWDVDPDRLAGANYLKHDNSDEMERIWREIEADIGIDVDDVPAPDGYAQSQEGIRWVRVTDYDDKLERTIGPDRETFIPAHNDWLRWHLETDRPIALIYKNCD